MKVLVVGATGTLGRQITRCALDAGHQVRCLVRSSRRAAFLKEWGAEVVIANLCYPDTLKPSLDGMDAVIDAATSRPSDSGRIHEVDWDGKVALIQAAQSANIKRFIFFSILDAEKHLDVPLMEMKHCTELFLAESGLNHTILKPCGFMQGLIGQYAMPILDKQAIWITGDTSPIAFMNTQDIARLTIRALETPEAENRTLPVVGNRAWSPAEIIELCERLSGKTAKVTRVPLSLLRSVRRFVNFFEWGWNVADRLAFTEVIASGQPLNASMDETYAILGLDPAETTDLEPYLQEYFNRIMKKLKELGYEKEKKKKQRSPFKSSSSSQ